MKVILAWQRGNQYASVFYDYPIVIDLESRKFYDKDKFKRLKFEEWFKIYREEPDFLMCVLEINKLTEKEIFRVMPELLL